MIRRSRNGVVFYQFESLAQHPPVMHAIFTRLGGKSSGDFNSLNVGQELGDDPAAVQENLDLISQALGFDSAHLATAHQVHGARVAVVGADERGSAQPQTDSLISAEPGSCLLLRFADCLPLMLYDPVRRAIALVHAGWRGLVAGVVINTVLRLQHAFACRPSDLVAGLGPTIGPCCYKVGPDLISEVKRVFDDPGQFLVSQPPGIVHLDLPGAARWQLRQAGVQQIEDSGMCTACHTDEFFSYRAEQGRTGRFAAVLALRTP
ncbi:MAG: hypothetical protein AMJ93_03250 [Anaerolineae bacterium SM23_84]|nr:MAG: hypothetical protein AMJ93_03250 [Anaerolineae bacterium SM23_84]